MAERERDGRSLAIFLRWKNAVWDYLFDVWFKGEVGVKEDAEITD